MTEANNKTAPGVLRPKADTLHLFLPLWDARNKAIERGDKEEEARLTKEMRQYQEYADKVIQGEYRVEHLRPIPEKLSEFMPLWEARNRAIEAGNREAEEVLTAQMRPLQFNASETEVFPNLVTNVGRADLNDKYLKGSTYTQTIRMGLKGTGSAANGDTQASHAGWLEQGLANAPTYTGNRKDVTMGSSTVASPAVSTSPVQAFAITSSGTVHGCFINNGGSATKDNTTGILFSAGDFTGGSKAVVNLDTLNVTYTLSTS